MTSIHIFKPLRNLANSWIIAISILFFITLASSRVRALSTASVSSRNEQIRVYDNILPDQSRDALHEAASKLGSGHKVFTRPLSKNRKERPIPLIERALDSILFELGDEAEYVEYWTRQEWRHIEAHADVDEYLAKEHDDLIAKGENHRQMIAI